MASPTYRRECGICGGTLKKNGTTSSGKTRWRCTQCGASSVLDSPGRSRQAQITRFVTRLLSPSSRTENGLSRAERRSMDWCWNVEVPQPEVTGEVYTTIMADGTYFQSWCLIVAYNGNHVIGWQWANRESAPAYHALLSRFPQPTSVVIDGHAGAYKAVTHLWPGVLVQRCLFHIQARVRQLITLTPRTECGLEIHALTRALGAIHTPIQAASWLVQYFQWETRWANFLKERTYRGRKDHSIHDTRRWWWTHRELRSVRGMYRRMMKDNTLFAYLTPLQANPNAQPLPRTTSPLEGGINAGIKALLRAHRGLSETHARRAVEWYLNSKTEQPYTPAELIRPKHWTSQPTPPPAASEPLGPAHYDTAINTRTPYDDGLWIRHGWAGRWKP